MIFGRKQSEPEVGQEVMTNDDEEFGTVSVVQDDYLEVTAGPMDHRTTWRIPRSAISKIDDEAIHLSMSRAQMLAKGWQLASGSGGQNVASTNV